MTFIETVDGRNAVPLGMYKEPVDKGHQIDYSPYQLGAGLLPS